MNETPDAATVSPATVEAPPVAMDDEGQIAEDVDCRRCGYNLRGLAVDGRCPECTTSIGRSVHGDLLQFCDPAWVERLADGMRLYVIVIVVSIMLGVLAATGLGISMAVTGTLPVPLLIGLTTVATLVTAVQVYVYWTITAPDPGRDETERPITARAVARYGLIISAVVSLPAGLLDPGKLGGLVMSGNPSPALTAARWALAIATLVISLVGIGALFIYAISLARRVPDDVLAARTRIVMWGYLITTGLMGALERLANAIVPGSVNPPQTEAVFGILIAIVALTGIVFWIWSIVLIYQYRNRLTRAAARARETWAGEP